MGELMRRYFPVVRSAELEPGGRTKRVRLLGEDLVAFRSRDGRVGLMDEFCSHRRASLYFAQRGGRAPLRVPRLEVRLRRPVSRHAQRAAGDLLPRQGAPPAYPCAERCGGVAWTYMGPGDPPALPGLEWTTLPDDQRFVSKFDQECNYLNGLEGGVDPAHISFLHGVVDGADDALLRELDQASAGFLLAAQLERAPHLEVAARRSVP
jgi:phthalate 4,5-dioxygenase